MTGDCFQGEESRGKSRYRCVLYKFFIFIGAGGLHIRFLLLSGWGGMLFSEEGALFTLTGVDAAEGTD